MLSLLTEMQNPIWIVCRKSVIYSSAVNGEVNKKKCTHAAKKVKTILGCFRQSIASSWREVILLFIALGSPHLEHCCQLWASHFKRGVDMQDKVQRKAQSLKTVKVHLDMVPGNRLCLSRGPAGARRFSRWPQTLLPTCDSLMQWKIWQTVWKPLVKYMSQ